MVSHFYKSTAVLPAANTSAKLCSIALCACNTGLGILAANCKKDPKGFPARLENAVASLDPASASLVGRNLNLSTAAEYKPSVRSYDCEQGLRVILDDYRRDPSGFPMRLKLALQGFTLSASKVEKKTPALSTTV